MAPVVSSAALAALPSGGQGAELARWLRALDTDRVMLFAPPSGGTVHCRMFAPGFAVPEDPATGSAAGALGAYLAHHGLLPVVDGMARFVVRQGLEIQRPSTITVEVPVAPDGIGPVRVGGQAVRVITGEVML
jgi:trans-2,3-dihydro-3-hydroxyanthranilate isomerase